MQPLEIEVESKNADDDESEKRNRSVRNSVEVARTRRKMRMSRTYCRVR